ncbi:hypothetical protein EUTSA_v10011239mg [Eutrema salsugineum]|uniref:Jacalin-type lectin domain-containing protein n=1 Tax=Eutrema salsugineum TaxID=72664 RepID=V4KK03_EUTSA|nr:hypothetical protein EUTSA_v10011239mg [Eutrema salsugineum]
MSWDDGKHTKVKRVQLTFDDVIRSIQVEYVGTTLQSQRRGNGGTKSDGFTLSSDEYITGLSGYYRTTFSGDIITALTFKTNKKAYGPYGNKTQHYFSAEAPSGNQIAGFLGTSGNALNSLDVHFAPIPPAGSIGPKPDEPETKPPGQEDSKGDGSGIKPPGQEDSKGDGFETKPPGQEDSKGDGSGTKPPGKEDSKGDGSGAKPPGQEDSKGDGPGKTGLIGGNSGDAFDDGRFGGVKKITVGADEYSVTYIKIEYVKDGKVQTLEHGTIRGELQEFSVDYPKEHITAVGGSYDHIFTYDTTLITSLYFTTSNGITSPLFGKQSGKDFNLKGENGGKLVGFHGRGGAAINAIGAYFDTSSKGGDDTKPVDTDTKPGKDDSKPDASGKTGLLGGKGGNAFDDGRFDGVKKITVGADDLSVTYIKIEYIKDGKVEIREHGTNRGELKEFSVDYPKDKITAVGGSYDHIFTYDATLVTSLYFTTSNGITSPLFGKTSGNDFNLKGENGEKLVGFHGRGGTAIDAIGAYFDTSSDSSTQRVDAQGGKGGIQWDDGGDHDGVTKILLVGSGRGIDQIKFDYLENKQPKEGTLHGVKGRRSFESTIEISHPNEYLVSVKGWYDASNVIQGLQFKTSTKTSDYFVSEFAGDGTEFTLEVKDKKIVGFHGFADTGLNSLGAYFAPISSTPVKPIKKLKAVGGDEGTSWDDGPFDGVRKINVGQNNDGVSFVEIEYTKGSQTVLGDGHGKKSPLGVETFELNPGEYIKAVGVYYDKVYVGNRGEVLVTSLVFITNERTSPPFGMTGGEYVELKEEGQKIVGFYGKASDWVHQIGVYVTPIAN